MMNDNIVLMKALHLLQNLVSTKKINKLLLPLNEEFQKDNDSYHYFSIIDYYPIVYEESIAMLVELSTTIRREIENYGSVQAKIKYPNTGKYCETNQDISFNDMLSKIIHARSIELQTKSRDGTLHYGYEGDRSNEFTGIALIHGLKKDKSPYTATVDIIKMCVDIFVMYAFLSC